MASNHDHEFDATKPALVLLYGNTSKKHRYLDREVIIVGRARGCDVGLDAPDISSVHCIITRAAGGFSLRDCQSRSGSKVNGIAVHDTALHHGDLLQLGPVSFRLHLPAGCQAPMPHVGSRLHHLECSRRNLARMALRLRKLHRLDRAVQGGGSDHSAVQDELSKKESALNARIHDYDQRVRALEDAERGLSRDRQTLEAEKHVFRDMVQKNQQEPAQCEHGAAEKELNKKESALNARIHDYDQRVRTLEEAERGLSRDRQTLEAEKHVFHDMVQKTEQELAQRRTASVPPTQPDAEQANLERQREQLRLREQCLAEQTVQLQQREAEVNRQAEGLRQRLDKREQKLQALAHNLEPRLKEHEARCREVDVQQREATAKARLAQQRAEELKAQAQELDNQRQLLEAETRKQQHQQRELDAQARQLEFREQHLQATLVPQNDHRTELEALQRQLALQQQESTAKLAELERQRKESSMMRDHCVHDQTAVIQRLGQQKAALAQAEEALREQRLDLDDLLANLQEEGSVATAGSGAAELEALREENQQLRSGVVERAAAADSLDKDLARLRQENEELRHLVDALEQKLQAGKAAPTGAGADAAVIEPPADQTAEVERLRQLVDEKEKAFRDLNRQIEEQLGRTEMGFVEVQLVAFRRQLESDREKLNRDIEQVRIRNAELDEATREMELEMSRDRADLARERQRLERLREEVLLDQERLQREGGVRDRLVPLQTLRDEMANKRANDQTPRPGKDDVTPGRARAART
jgi:chromosome segregation ATPase